MGHDYQVVFGISCCRWSGNDLEKIVVNAASSTILPVTVTVIETKNDVAACDLDADSCY